MKFAHTGYVKGNVVHCLAANTFIELGAHQVTWVLNLGLPFDTNMKNTLHKANSKWICFLLWCWCIRRPTASLASPNITAGAYCGLVADWEQIPAAKFQYLKDRLKPEEQRQQYIDAHGCVMLSQVQLSHEWTCVWTMFRGLHNSFSVQFISHYRYCRQII